MKRMKFSVDIHKNGTHNDAIIAMITNHNEGKVDFDFNMLRGYLRARFCQYPTIMPEVSMNENVGSHTLEIYEKEKPTLTIIGKIMDEVEFASEAPTIHRQNTEA